MTDTWPHVGTAELTREVELLHPETPIAARFTEHHREHARNLLAMVRLLREAPSIMATMSPERADTFARVMLRTAADGIEAEVKRLQAMGFGTEVSG